MDYIHSSSKRVSRRVSLAASKALNNFYYQKFATISWCILMLICFAAFIGGVSSSSSSTSQTVSVVNNCLLYAVQEPVFNLTASQNQTIQVQFGKGFSVAVNNSCHSAVIEGVAAIMFVLFITVVTCVYLYSSPTKEMAQAVAYMAIILTFFTVSITALANIGLYQTCANSTFCNIGDSSFQNNYNLVFAAIISGWIASALLFVFTACAWFTVGTHSANHAGSFFNSTLGGASSRDHRASITASESASVRSLDIEKARYSKRASTMSDLPTPAAIAKNGGRHGKRVSSISASEQLPAWRHLQINTGSTFVQDHRTSTLREEV